MKQQGILWLAKACTGRSSEYNLAHARSPDLSASPCKEQHLMSCLLMWHTKTGWHLQLLTGSGSSE